MARTLTYYTADPHFGHVRIPELVPLRQETFGSLERMDNELIARWNDRVTQRDVVYVLGDFMLGLALEERLPKVLARLNGYKILVAGNHDRPSPAVSRNADKRERWYRVYRDAGFDVVLGADGTRSYERWVTELGENVLLSHYPYDGESFDGRADRYRELRPVDDGRSLLVHGHVHEQWRTRGRQFNVGVDVNDFAPVAEETIIEWAKELRVEQPV